MTIFTDFLADKRAARIVLVDLVSTNHGTHRIASQTWVTSPSDSPANTIYDGVLIGDVEIERRMSGPMGLRGGVANASDIVIANPSGARDAWPLWDWQSAAIYYGDPSWPLATIQANGLRGTWSIETVESDDLEIRFRLRDRYEDLRQPIATTIEYRGGNMGNYRPLSFGYPKNLKPQVRDQDPTPVFIVGEGADVEDEVVARYINQDASTSPSIDKYGYSWGLNGDPNGVVTCDTKGIQGPGATWPTKPGEVLELALTRTHTQLTGFARGGSANTMQLEDGPNVSDQDDFYNGDTLFKSKVDDPAQDDHESGTINDYDGASRTATISGTWTLAAVAGDGYEIDGHTVQAGPLTASDLDGASFDALDVSLPYEVGIWINDRRSGVDLLDEVLSPIGFHTWTPDDRLTVGLLDDPANGTPAFELTDQDIPAGPAGIELVDIQHPVYRMRVGYDRNFTVEVGGSAGSIDPARLDWITKEYRHQIREDFSILEDDPLARDVEIPTVFTAGAAARAVRDLAWALFAPRRSTWVVQAFTEPMGLKLGDVVKITDARHGFDAGAQLVLLGRRENLSRGTCEMELWK